MRIHPPFTPVETPLSSTSMGRFLVRGEYKRLGLPIPFDQALRLQRQLVAAVLDALLKVDKIRRMAGRIDTPNSDCNDGEDRDTKACASKRF
jgi:hypothetical protein